MKVLFLICGLLLASLTRSMPLIKNKETGRAEISDSQRQILLRRLDHADGDNHQLSFFKMALSSQRMVGSCKEQGNCTEEIIDAIERIAVWYVITGHQESSMLRQTKLYTEQLKDAEENYKTILGQLPESTKNLHGIPMNESIYGFLNCELKKLHELQLELLLVKNSFKIVWPRVCDISAYCAAALQSGIKVMGILTEKRESTVRRLASWLHLQYISKVIKSPFTDNLDLFGKRDEISSPRDIAADINYLREGLSVTIKAGVFLLLCLQYQVYLCSVAFGFLTSISCFIWISLYLEMVRTTV